MRISVLLLLFFLVLSASATMKDKKKKEKVVEVYGLVDPDPMPQKPRPEHHNRPLDQPLMIYDDGKGLCGFDMSHYQGRVDWDALSSDPNAGFVYLKASEGSSLKDNMYITYYNEARRVGLKVGSYHFFRPNCTAREQFENFRSMIRGRHQDLIPIIDVEVQSKGVSMYLFYDRLAELLQLVEKEVGRKPMIYTGQRFYNNHFSSSRFRGVYPFMIACYTFEEPVLYNNDDFLIWQFTGYGKAKGVRGHIDISRFVRGHKLREIMF
ncbi:MAG: glycosyl hydrolase family 25 [Bacteroidaceae bacterium]|nr:glycosyl hydrolase family 25 [Bacteroidaceae bacterium]